MKNKTFLLSVLALVLIACAVIHPALAYFTDNDNADGAIPLYFGRWTEIKEDVQDLEKKVTIQNTGGDHPELADPVWIRAKVYIADAFTQYMTVTGDGWSEGTDGYWNYDTPVLVVGSTNVLDVKLDKLPANLDPEFLLKKIEVSVVYESTTAYYAEDGVSFQPVVWNDPLDTGESSPTTP